MTARLTRAELATQLAAMGLRAGDIALVRASLKPIGRIEGGSNALIGALLDILGPEGTLVSLAFTDSYFARRADPDKPFTAATPTYAGALPQGMLAWPGALRSSHPTCSYVAIGRHAAALVEGHDAYAGAYEPVRKMIEYGAKGLLIGCVGSSPGFTSAHLAECDLGLHRRVIAPWLTSVYFINPRGKLDLFRRRDFGLCSISFRKFYGPYVNDGILTTGRIGQAYSASVPLAASYQIERKILGENPRFTICGEPDCVMCNLRRWDQLHKVPSFVFRKLRSRLLGDRASHA